MYLAFFGPFYQMRLASRKKPFDDRNLLSAAWARLAELSNSEVLRD